MRELLRRFNIPTLVGIVVIFYLAIILIQIVKRNYDLQKQIGSLNQEITTLRDEQEELRYRIEYYRTQSFQEKQARAKLGLQDPGEGVIILPRTPDQPAEEPAADRPDNRTNLEKWKDFLLGKSVDRK